MCIIFLYIGYNDEQSDYSVILASNRDEFYDRPAQNLAPWKEDPNVIGGRDLGAGDTEGTWLAISPLRKKIGVLLNLPGVSKQETQSRGKIIADFIKDDICTGDYVTCLRNSNEVYNEFVLVTVEFGNVCPMVYTYSNASHDVDLWTDEYLGFSNSLPKAPLKKAETGKYKLRDIVTRLHKISMKEQLIDELINMLKSDEKHLPDPELQKRQPLSFEHLSSTYVHIPEKRYGTRTHTLVLVSKTGHIDMIEFTLQMPVDTFNTEWTRTEFQFDNYMKTCYEQKL